MDDKVRGNGYLVSDGTRNDAPDEGERWEMKTFEGQNIYVTGGSSGIGLSAAKLLAGSGANVLIFARTEERLEQALKEIEGQRTSDDQRFSSMRLDVSEHQEVNRVMSLAVESFGIPDVMINAAGKAHPRHFEDIPYEQFDEIMKTNFYGVWNTVKALVPHMKKRGGHIVNIASMAGFIGVFGFADYAASKFAMIGFSETIRSELKRYGIRVSVLCPPDTDTPGFELENRTKPEETKAISGTVKLMDPDEVARALIRGVRKGRFMIFANAEGRFIYLLKRLAPSVLDWIIERDIKKVQAGKK
jgi:NAD(P)-dependent dehydrogenase (short-subunit alcohol dehydrogenase family)